MSMFCYQCQETAMGTGCTLKGVCGKTSEVANLQDLLLFVVRGIAVYNEHLRKEGQSSEQADKFIYDALFITITNANFDKVAITEKIKEGLKLKKELAGKVKIENAPDECLWDGNEEEFEEKSKTVGVLRTPNEDIRSLKELVHYGLKGMAAYVEHAHNLGYQSPEIFAFMQHALSELTRNDITVEELVQLTLETGKHGVSAMAQLDKANTSSYGNPEISQVNLGVRNHPGILISGHDLKDLEELLEQTEGTGVDVYTHSEMLPAHYYPQLKKYKHLAGNYGNAWWKQKEEFESFNGPILFTSNCIVPPRANASYKDRIYITGACGLEGAHYIPERKDGKPKDFSALIAHAKQPDRDPDPRGRITYDEFDALYKALKEEEKPPKNDRMPPYFKEFFKLYLEAQGKENKQEIPWEDRLAALYYAYAMKNANKFVSDWFCLNLNINNMLTAITCRKHGFDKAGYIVGDNEVAQALRTSNARDFGLGDTVDYLPDLWRIAEETDLMVREKKVDLLKWEWLEEHTFFKPFDIESVFAYLLKLEMIERWVMLDKATGEKTFREIVGAMKKGSEHALEEFGKLKMKN